MFVSCRAVNDCRALLVVCCLPLFRLLFVAGLMLVACCWLSAVSCLLRAAWCVVRC